MEHKTPLTGLRNKGTVSSAPKGLDFVRAAIAQAVGGNAAAAERYAEKRWGDTAGLRVKAALPAMNTQADGGASLISSESGASEFFDLVRAASVLGKLPVHRVPFYQRLLTQDEGPRVAWRDHGGAYGNSPLKLTAVTGLEPFDLGALIVATDEALRDSSIEAELHIRNQLVRALATGLDEAFISSANSGSAGVKPASVTSGASGSVSPSEALFDWSDEYQGDWANSWILLHPATAARISGAARPDVGRGFWGAFPVLLSSAVGIEEIVILDPSQIAVALSPAGLRVSSQAAIDMSDTSSMASGGTVAQASMVSMFQTNSKAIIGSVNANWAVLRDDAVMVYNTFQYGL
jgi:hypothetical protein